jgi:hypothetical protein
LDYRDDDGQGPAARLEPRTLNAAALEVVYEVNAQLLEVLASPQPAALQLAPQVADVIRAMPASYRQRAARCPYLLVDGGFRDEKRWCGAVAEVRHLSSLVTDGSPVVHPSAFRLAHLTFTCAWIVVCTDPGSAEWQVGMSPKCASLISQLSLENLRLLAELHADWALPLRANRPDRWRQLFTKAPARLPCPLSDPALRAWQLFLSDEE